MSSAPTSDDESLSVMPSLHAWRTQVEQVRENFGRPRVHPLHSI